MSHGLRWALLGASTIARQRMVGAIRTAGGTVVAIQSTDRNRAEAFAAEFKLPLAVTDVESALVEADAVYISSTNDRHHDQALAALAAGRHVLCEKPIATDLDQAHAMIAAARLAGRVLAVNHHLRHNAAHRAIREHIIAGSVGAVRAVTISNAGWLPEELRRWRLAGEGSGIALDKTVHDIDLLRYLLGTDPVDVMAMRAGPAGLPEQAVMGVIEFGNGVIAQFHDDFNARNGQTRLEIIGEDGRLTAEDCLSGRPAGTLVHSNAQGHRHIPINHVDPYADVIRDLHHAVATGTAPAASGWDGAMALSAALAAVRSARSGTRITIESSS
jgi:1,5-anhydro-D-fructose reductase (1,5-anhydro-D-mannitol-forming)